MRVGRQLRVAFSISGWHKCFLSVIETCLALFRGDSWSTGSWPGDMSKRKKNQVKQRPCKEPVKSLQIQGYDGFGKILGWDEHIHHFKNVQTYLQKGLEGGYLVTPA